MCGRFTLTWEEWRRVAETLRIDSPSGRLTAEMPCALVKSCCGNGLADSLRAGRRQGFARCARRLRRP
jgi:hypothetical protein